MQTIERRSPQRQNNGNCKSRQALCYP